MSLVPRLNRGEIVLRHGSAVVVYDERSRQLSLRARSQGPSDVDFANPNCPYCHRPLRDEARSPTDDSPDDNEHGFVNPEYFRMLHHSRPSSETSSRQPSPQPRAPPRRALRQTSGGSDISTPPPGAEFVGSAPATPAAPHGISSSAFSQNYFKTFFVEEGELGRGGKGVVLLVRHVLDGVSLGHFACKRVPVGDDHEWLEKVLVEVQLLQNLSHQNLVSYRHVWLEDYQISAFGPSVPCAFILQQYCNAGDLHHYILNQAKASVTTQELKERMRRRSKGHAEPPIGLNSPRRMPFEEIYSFFKDITAGLHHLHSHGYIHRDLKPHNCLLHTVGSKTRVLVSDFGEVQMVDVVRKSTGHTGTISYCAPEVLRREADGEFGNFTTKSDIFSLGMIVYFMCFGRLPYQNADDLHEENEDLDQLRAEIASWQGFDDVRKARSDLPDKLYSFLKRLLSLNPAERPTTEQILHGIGAGSGLEDINGFGPMFDDIGPRISSAESPSPSPSKLQRRQSTQAGLLRAAPSKLRQQASAEDHRSPSPPMSRKPPSSTSRTPTPPDSAGLILRKRKLENYSPPPSSPHHHHHPHHPSSPTSPARLMLPPSPSSTFILYVHNFLTTPAVVSAIKLTLFLVKILSLSRPCAPFAANPWVAYPLLCLAALDFGPFLGTVVSYYPYSWRGGGSGTARFSQVGLLGSLVMLVVHVAVTAVAARWDCLCAAGANGAGAARGGMAAVGVDWRDFEGEGI
ncbi:hypothetical protein BFW01_g6909 [Lasiodiplodia theobromae]|uniref:non-specific serine/threonine protein kinase n=1 Tax=Lasiodiplodia theobromae TaxID=45133 RepID=A0A5N5DSQ7_9PEZI|nr:putative serine/threonine-protein kinase IKS1 [Lasiodiplodia theobromae]KAF9636014.1 hypothetical protein BFW01_g6909 [Lasiodiplodia theobromae]